MSSDLLYPPGLSYLFIDLLRYTFSQLQGTASVRSGHFRSAQIGSVNQPKGKGGIWSNAMQCERASKQTNKRARQGAWGIFLVLSFICHSNFKFLIRFNPSRFYLRVFRVCLYLYPCVWDVKGKESQRRWRCERGGGFFYFEYWFRFVFVSRSTACLHRMEIHYSILFSSILIFLFKVCI